jgi:drug/metabolite transporter (DMT)-like permease
MIELLLSRTTVITLAVLGALFAALASLLQRRAGSSSPRAKQLNALGYLFMAVSMVLFIVAGFWGVRP